MNTISTKILLLIVIITNIDLPQTSADTFLVPQKSRRRMLRVTREYEINVRKGQPSVADIPAIMSFWGATNWQVVGRSKFDYTQEPDSIEIISDNLGMPRRFYKMTWNCPDSNTIVVKHNLAIQLVCFNTLHTKAQLPYSDKVLKRFPSSLTKNLKEGINTDNPQLTAICNQIRSKAGRDAEKTVELVCDWINDNIVFEIGQRSSDQALREKKGSCTPMSKLACAMLRKMEIPSEVVSGKFIGGDSGHSYIEVFFPDAGWVFYDLSNWNRGFKSLDCLMTVGWAYRSGTPMQMRWVDGYFCKESDMKPFKEFPIKSNNILRREPSKLSVAGVKVDRTAPPVIVQKRDIPMIELILDLNIPPGQRDKP